MLLDVPCGDMLLSFDPLRLPGRRTVPCSEPSPLPVTLKEHGTQGPSLSFYSRQGTYGHNGANDVVGVGSSAKSGMLEPLRTETPITYNKNKRRCVDCGRGTHLRFVRSFSKSGFLDVGFPLCQSSARRRGGSYLSALQRFTA